MSFATNAGYETLPATQMLATHCIYCGKELEQPHSIEQGCGDICAEKYGVFAPTHGIDHDSLERVLATAPESLREAVTRELQTGGPEEAMKRVNHIVGAHWIRKTEDWKHYMGSAIEIADAMGFSLTAAKLRGRYIEGKDRDYSPTGFTVVASSGGLWRLKLPYERNYAVWKSTVQGILGAGAREIREGKQRFYDFAPERWPAVLNALVTNYAGELGSLPTGETFLIPDKPVPVAAPLTPGPTGAPDVATNETVKLAPLEKGMLVQLNDGREMVIGWVGSDRIGVWSEAERDAWLNAPYRSRGRPSYTFLGTNEIKAVKATATEKQEASDQAAGAEARAPEPYVRKEREYPAAMFPYQREGAVWLDTVGSGILAYDMGLGKTITAAAVMDPPVVVVCPASLRVNWVREITRWRPDLTVAAIGTEGKETRETMQSKLRADVVVINYDILKGDKLDMLIARGAKTLVSDEGHFMKELKVGPRKDKKTGRWSDQPSGAARGVNFWKLAQVSSRRIILTGTPMLNGRPYELYPLLHLVAPKDWPSFKKYCQRYCAPQEMQVRGKRFTNYNGKANLDELRERVHGTYMLRKTKDELDLPEKQRHSTDVTMEDAAAKEYRAAADEFIAWVRRRGGPQAAARAAKAEIIARLTALRRLCAIGKVPAVLEMCEAHLKGTGRPLIIFGHHIEPLESLVTALRELNFKVAEIRGGMSDRSRNDNKDWFQDGRPFEAPPEERDYADVIVCSIKSAGVGLTLTRASDVFFLERDWRPFDLVQAEDRAHRIGQTNKVTITYFDAAGTIDSKLKKLLLDKMKTAAQVIDGIDYDQEDDAAMAVFRDMFGEEALEPNAGDFDEEELYDWLEPEV